MFDFSRVTQSFVANPFPAFIISAIFFCMYGIGLLLRPHRSSPGWPVLVPGFAWLSYGLWELFIMGPGIRVDLLIIWPLLIVTSLYGPVIWLRKLTQGTTDA